MYLMPKENLKLSDGRRCNQLPCSEDAFCCSSDGKGTHRRAHSLMGSKPQETGNDLAHACVHVHTSEDNESAIFFYCSFRYMIT